MSVHPIFENILKAASGTLGKPKTEYPECMGDPKSCPENEGYGCCKPNPSRESETNKGEAV